MSESINFLYRCEDCGTELIGGVVGDKVDRHKPPVAIGCLVCGAKMTPQGELSEARVQEWRDGLGAGLHFTNEKNPTQ